MGTSAASPRRSIALWAGLVVAVVVAGIVLPPLGAVAALALAIYASAHDRRDIRLLAVVLLVVFVLLTIFVGVFLFDSGGGSGGTVQRVPN